MRTLSASLFLSLDGVVESPQDWHFASFTADVLADAMDHNKAVDLIVLGRCTYQEWLPVWPQQGTSDPLAAFLNTTPKLVVSTTLDTLEWDTCTLVGAEVMETLAAAKAEQGGEIAVFGSGVLVTSLLSAGLLDELRVQVHPILVGSGKRLFDGGASQVGLSLTNTVTYSGGTVGLTFRPER